MKVAILAGGLGTRLAEQTEVRPKPMVKIGDRPILWHIMKHYSHYGFNEFVLALGYKGETIKRYFMDYLSLSGSIRLDLGKDRVEYQGRQVEQWVIHLVETGLSTNTGGRVKRLESHLGSESTFMMTYGDGISDVDIPRLLDFHKEHGRHATVTAVRPPARFGGLTFEGDMVSKFVEKPQIGEGWINGGFFVFEPKIFDYVTEGDDTSFEALTLPKLAKAGQLAAFRHYEFWQCMDTIRDLTLLRGLWEDKVAPWKIWGEDS